MNSIRKFFKSNAVAIVDIRDITHLDTPLGRQVIEIYERSFPEAERDPIENLATSLKNDDLDTAITHIRALVEHDQVVGFTCFATYRAYYLGFLKFIAVREDIRGKGYGPILLQDALQQLRKDGKQATGWSYLGLVLEVERPELAETEAERKIRERRIQFYLRNGAAIIEGTDYIAPPVAPGQPPLPFHLMVIKAVNKYGMQRWLRTKAVKALLVEGYGEDEQSWFVRHALELRRQAVS